MDFIFMDASKVARIGLKAMFKGKREVIPGVVNRLGVFLTWLMPRSLVEKIVQKFFAT